MSVRISLPIVIVFLLLILAACVGSFVAYMQVPQFAWHEYKSDVSLDAGADFTFPLHTAAANEITMQQQLTVQAELPIAFIRLSEEERTMCYAMNVSGEQTIDCPPVASAMLRVRDHRDTKVAVAGAALHLYLGDAMTGKLFNPNHVTVTNRLLVCTAHCAHAKEWVAEQQRKNEK